MSLPTMRVLHERHADYPIRIRAMDRPPPCLYVRGTIPARPAIAIVGTRAATDDALLFTKNLATQLTRFGVCVWSGGAAGIDGAAHAGALEGPGPTVVVMGTGLDHVYPTEHRPLFTKVLEHDGAWISPFPSHQPGARWTFLLRNEVLASLVDGILVVQAPIRSGARSTAAAARRMGRRLWVVPAAPWDSAGAGCVEELRLGADLFRSAQNIAAVLLGRASAPAPQLVGPSPLPADLSQHEALVANCVRRSSVYLDEVCEHTGLDAGTVTGALLTLTLRHVVVEGSDGRFRFVTF